MSRLGVDNPDNSPLFVFYKFTEGSGVKPHTSLSGI